jgi:hypothetical protein
MNDWIAIVNKAMEGIEGRQIEVPKGTDTTETSLLRKLFLRYLTHRQIKNGQAHMIALGHVYHADGMYYFDADGFRKFLSLERFSTRNYNLREQLISYGCAEGEVAYKTAKGINKTLPCWRKADDEELLGMDAFYEDVYDGDADILQKNKLNKEEREATDGGDTKF